MLNGQPSILSRRARSAHWVSAIRDAARLATHWRTTPMNRVSDFVLRPLLVELAPKRVRVVARRRRDLQRWTWATGETVTFLRDRHGAIVSTRSGWTNADRINAMLKQGLLDLADGRGQLEAISGCTRVDPLLDDELVQFIASLTPESLLEGHTTRGLYRCALRGWVPESLRLRRDKGSFEPALMLMIGQEGVERLRELADVPMLADAGLAEPKLFRAQFERIFANGWSSPDWLTVWPALAVEAFLRWHRAAP